MYSIDILEAKLNYILNEMIASGKDAIVIETPEDIEDIIKAQKIAKKHGYNIFYYNNEYLLIYYSTRKYYLDLFIKLMDTNDKMLIAFVISKINGYSNNTIHTIMNKISESEKKD